MGFDPGPDGTGIVVPPNHSWFRIAHLPPHAEMQAMLAQVSSGDIDADGFHTTNSIDYVLVLDGPVELLLDDGSVIVEPGDCVVQRGTNHAWRNHGDKPIRLIAVLIGTP